MAEYWKCLSEKTSHKIIAKLIAFVLQVSSEKLLIFPLSAFGQSFSKPTPPDSDSWNYSALTGKVMGEKESLI